MVLPTFWIVAWLVILWSMSVSVSNARSCQLVIRLRILWRLPLGSTVKDEEYLIIRDSSKSRGRWNKNMWSARNAKMLGLSTTSHLRFSLCIFNILALAGSQDLKGFDDTILYQINWPGKTGAELLVRFYFHFFFPFRHLFVRSSWRISRNFVERWISKINSNWTVKVSVTLLLLEHNNHNHRHHHRNSILKQTVCL